jgi:hypothetical protein
MRGSCGEMDVRVHKTGDDDLVGKVDFQGARLVQRRSGSIGSHVDYFMAPRDYSYVVICLPARSIEEDPTTKNPLLGRCEGRRLG